MTVQDISINDYDYPLPEDKIALHPLKQRDASKLLVYKNGIIHESIFSDIDKNLPSETLLVFNNTKVINARINFTKTTGSSIEIFCLEPHGKIVEYSTVLSSTQAVQWKCFVGGAAKWKQENVEKEIEINGQKIILSARKIEKITEAFIVEFSWSPSIYSFAEIIEAAGKVPLPPYIKRNTDDEDTSRYQTIFATYSGSVAAPTAGLHFTENIFEKLNAKKIEQSFVTLHVGAGTFKPVKADTMATHEMHAEYIDVDIAFIEKLKNNIGNIAVVGTTSLRTIETLYWIAVKINTNKKIEDLIIQQWDAYEQAKGANELTATDALSILINWMKEKGKKNLFTQTQILIAPGYTFRLANILITNFHQPKSTLLLLVAAAMGENWKKMYRHALENNFRFLSYGDANLIFIDK
jgi:S-adenosylmethionine:tRNA ribosyltransferase-isomerase